MLDGEVKNMFFDKNSVWFVNDNNGIWKLNIGQIKQGRRRASFAGTKNCGGEKARAGREFLSPQPPFLPAPPERKSFLLCRPAEGGSNQNSKSGFSSKKVRTSIKKHRQLGFFKSLEAASLRSAANLYGIFGQY